MKANTYRKSKIPLRAVAVALAAGALLMAATPAAQAYPESPFLEPGTWSFDISNVSQHGIDPGSGNLLPIAPATVPTGLESRDIYPPPENITPPTISGTPHVKQLLFCSPGTWSNDPYSYTYQWLRDGLEISGATNQIYTPVDADAGTQVSCEVTATNEAGSATAQSDAVEVIGVPSNTAPPEITGSPYVGQELTCAEGEWINDPTDYTHQWLRNGSEINGATNPTYTLVGADAGSSITCTVTASNAAGNASATSSAVSVPAQSPPTPPGPAPSSAAQTAAFSEACNLQITSPKVGASKAKETRVTTSQARRLFTHGVKGTMKWGTVNGRDVICKKIKMVILQQRGKSYYIPGTRTQVSKKILTRKTFSTQGSRFLKKRKVGKLRKKVRSSKRLTKISFKDFNRRSKLGRRALNDLRKKGYRGKFLVLYSAEVDGTTVLKKIQLTSRVK